MFIPIYKVTAPKVIEEFIEQLVYDASSVIVHVDFLAICKADIRYFLGNRDINVLNHKYPLAPIHEAVGHVIKDPTNTFKVGDKVILVPNEIDTNKCKGCPNLRCKEKEFGNNYCPYANFKSSSSDGFMKEFYSCKPDQLVKFDDSVPSPIAVFSELLSVGVAACRRIDFTKVKRVALFGDGIMAYIVYIVLTRLHCADVTVFGVNEDKMKLFKKAKTCKYDLYSGENFDTLIECVGGRASEIAINQMIDISLIGADLILMGVSENHVQINTRKILEKGISLKGVTRSNTEDFKTVAQLISLKEVQNDLSPLVLSTNEIKSVNDIYLNFEKEINNSQILGKNLMFFEK